MNCPDCNKGGPIQGWSVCRCGDCLWYWAQCRASSVSWTPLARQRPAASPFIQQRKRKP